MCDVYATPYLNEAQMTSGTLAYSFGLGKAVVSTPYWHARELLGRRARHSRSVWRCESHWLGDRGVADQRRSPACNAQTRVRDESINDMGANGQALSGGIRSGTRDESDQRKSASRSRSLVAPEQCLSCHSNGAFPLDVRQHGTASARRSLDTRPCSRLLRRRQRPCLALVDRAGDLWRNSIVRAHDGAFCSLHPARLEP